jgi:hypothetical protein
MKNNEMVYKKFIEVFNIWEKELNNYSYEQLSNKVEPDSWTLGQVYMHLIQATIGFHLPQVKICLENSANETASKNMKGVISYYIFKGIPPIKIKVPASDTYTPKHPNSIAEIKDGFEKVKSTMETYSANFAENKNGKTPHPGFGFLNASEWYNLVPWHWEHHLRQKSRIDQANIGLLK